MVMINQRLGLYVGILLAGLFTPIFYANAQSEINTGNTNDQTTTLTTPLLSGLPYSISLQTVGTSNTLPSLQSYATGEYNGDFVFVDGRTDGLHTFTPSGLSNFPPQYQNQNIYVLDPHSGQVWSRSLTNSDLSSDEINALSATAPEFAQSGSNLYIAGGYLYASSNFTTYPTLTSLNLAGVVDWVTNGTSNLSASVLQTTNPAVQVTGGTLHFVNGSALLTFGQDFEGPYSVNGSGSYTEQVRSFTIQNDGSNLSLTNITYGATNDAYRRRDLNVASIVGTGTNGPALVALSGVFTTNSGIWTVPVEVSSNGTASMSNPTTSNAFKQAMNNYACPTISLFSPSRQENDIVLAGGISEETYTNGAFTNDPNYGFSSQSSVVTRDSNGVYQQYYLGDIYPNINYPGTNTPALFGASASFLANTNLATIDGVINMDDLTNGATLGYIFGGIAAQTNDFGSTLPSSELFQVIYDVPEPSQFALLGFAIGIAGVVFFTRVSRRHIK